jgi:AcrR family transcriptional regulator
MSDQSIKQREKRSRMRGEERREYILAHAKHIFAHNSYAEASTGELARASGVTEPMLYKHFGSKKGLFLEVLCALDAKFMTIWSSRIDKRAEQDLLDALSQVIMDYRATLKADPDIHRVFFQAVAEASNPQIAHSVSKHNQETYTRVRALVERAQQEGLIEATIDPDVATWGYFSMLLAMQYSLMLNLKDRLTDKILLDMGKLWLRALRSPQK